jgi:hypothetical protein
MPRNWEFQWVACQREPAGRSPGCDGNNLLYSEGRQLYKGARPGCQNGNPGLNGLAVCKAAYPQGQNENPGLLQRGKRQWLPRLIRYSISMIAAV